MYFRMLHVPSEVKFNSPRKLVQKTNFQSPFYVSKNWNIPRILPIHVKIQGVSITLDYPDNHIHKSRETQEK